jgi:hypothetical protein
VAVEEKRVLPSISSNLEHDFWEDHGAQ